MVEGGGFEPPKLTAADLQSAPFGHSGTPPYVSDQLQLIRAGNLEPVKGFEPPTSGLQNRCSTPELHRQKQPCCPAETGQ